MDLQQAFDEGFDAVKAYVDRSLAGIIDRFEQRIKVIEDRKPEKGDPGQDGKSFTLECAKPVIAAAIEEIKKSIPEPRNPVDLVAASITRTGNLILTLSNGQEKDLGLVVGKDGAAGKDGKDGFSLDDFSAGISDDLKTVTLKFKSGDREKKSELVIPSLIYREIYREGTEYERGDVVTFGGSMWVCMKETTGKPGISNDWRLAVKKGRDAKEPASVR
jgi:hypothetical protein